MRVILLSIQHSYGWISIYKIVDELKKVGVIKDD